MVRLNNDALCSLLSKVKRTQTVAGKSQDQVNSCEIRFGKRATVTSLVKDGLTSVSRFSIPYDMVTTKVEPYYYVTDIDTMLGALKYHSTEIKLEQEGDRLRIKSSNKQTTLTASKDALAFPHNTKTIAEWSKLSHKLASSIEQEGMSWRYVTNMDDIIIRPTFVLELNAVTLYEALRCDSMNGQKINRYRFYSSTDGYRVETGKLLKGKTTSLISGKYVDDIHVSSIPFTAIFEGGLENLLFNYNRDIKLHFFDFSEYSQGWKLLLDFGNGDFVWQSSILESE